MAASCSGSADTGPTGRPMQCHRVFQVDCDPSLGCELTAWGRRHTEHERHLTLDSVRCLSHGGAQGRVSQGQKPDDALSTLTFEFLNCAGPLQELWWSRGLGCMRGDNGGAVGEAG